MSFSLKEMAYLKKLLRHYKNLDTAWLLKQSPQGRFSNMKLSFTTNSPWRASVHNLVPGVKEHLPENCILEIFEMNVQQHTAIPDLFEAFKQLWVAMINMPSPAAIQENVLTFQKNFGQTPGENGVCPRRLGVQYWADMRHLHLKHILRKSICNHLRKDKLMFNNSNAWYANPAEKTALVNACMDKLCVVQRTRCYYSGTLLSYGNNWSKISMERIDNSKPHFLPGLDLSNVIFVCRILNSTAGWNRAKLLTVFLTQKQVHVPTKMRSACKLEIERLQPCASN